MSFVADQKNGITFAGKADCFEMDLGDKGTGRINGVEVALGSSGPNSRCDTVRAIEDIRSAGDFIHTIDEDNAPPAKAVNDVPVVDDLVINVERCTVKLEGALETLRSPYSRRRKSRADWPG